MKEIKMKKKLIKKIETWIADYEETQPGNVCIDDEGFDGSAYFLLQQSLKELKK